MSYRILRVVVLAVAAIVPLQVAPVATAAAAVPTIAAIAAGYDHTCALTNSGGVKCWGNNDAGQLGNGTTTESLAPVDVVGLASGVTEIAAGLDITCALTSGGGVKCWGSNRFGQLGIVATTSSPTPLDISGLTNGVGAIAVGSVHTCVLTNGGGVKCLGGNAKGQLGNGTTTDSSIPVDVAGLASGVAAIAAGGDFTCALTTVGGVKCWGWNYIMELGNSTTTDSSIPVDVLGLPSGVSPIDAGGQHTCGLTTARRVVCWGNNVSGQLGNGTPAFGSAPVDVFGLTSGVSAITAGGYHTCAITSGGGVKCWGFNRFGELGNGSTTYSSVPVDVFGLTSGVTLIAAGDYHSCAITTVGGVKCWGWNGLGQPGSSTTNQSSIPVDVDFATHQTIILRASDPGGTISPGTAVTFTASVRPLTAAGAQATVRFVVYHLVGEVWRQAAHRDVTTSALGRAMLRWTFSTSGSWYVRAKALENETYAASTWSPSYRYTVRRPGCPDPPYTLNEIASVPLGLRRLACFGDQKIRFGAAVAYEPNLTFGGPPGFERPVEFLTGFAPDSVGLGGWRTDGAIAPRDRGLELGTEGCPRAGCDEVWWEVSGHFDADLAKLCRREGVIEDCQSSFFVDRMRVVRERHRVQRGETTAGIARERGVTLAALLGANPQIVDPNRIRTGDLITIPRTSGA